MSIGCDRRVLILSVQFCLIATSGRSGLDVTTLPGLGPEVLWNNLLLGLFNCANVLGFDDATLGHVDGGDTRDWSPMSMRALPAVTWCAPLPPDQMNVRFRLFYAGSALPDANWRTVDERLQNYHCFVFISSGWGDNYDTSGWMQSSMAYLSRNCLVIIVDWPYGCQQVDYFQSVANCLLVGKMVGHWICINGIAGNSVFIGFSLGAQMMNAVARYLREQCAESVTKLSYCVALDPAGPAFDSMSADSRLTPDDCDFVLALHTNAGDTAIELLNFLNHQWGTRRQCGHLDVWANCGHHQPAGGLPKITISSSHLAAHRIFVQALQGEAFPVTKCDANQCGPDVLVCDYSGITGSRLIFELFPDSDGNQLVGNYLMQTKPDADKSTAITNILDFLPMSTLPPAWTG